MRRSTKRVVALVAVLFLTLSARAYGEGAQVDLDRFTGVYELADPAQADERVKQAIHAVTDEMGFFTRGIARDKIRDEVVPSSRIELAALPDDRLRLVLDDWRPPPVALGGPPVVTTDPKGRPIYVSAHVDEQANALMLDGRTATGARRIALTLSPDAEHLTLVFYLTSDQLPIPIEYTLEYRRAG